MSAAASSSSRVCASERGWLRSANPTGSRASPVRPGMRPSDPIYLYCRRCLACLSSQSETARACQSRALAGFQTVINMASSSRPYCAGSPMRLTAPPPVAMVLSQAHGCGALAASFRRRHSPGSYASGPLTALSPRSVAARVADGAAVSHRHPCRMILTAGRRAAATFAKV